LFDNFFEVYAAAFLSFNSVYISEVYEFPMVFYTENGESVSFEIDAFTTNTKKLISLYEKNGVKNVSFKIESITELSKTLNLVSIIWNFQDEEKKTIYISTTRYVMRSTVQGLKIKSVLVVNETTELNKLVKK